MLVNPIMESETNTNYGLEYKSSNSDNITVYNNTKPL